MGVENNEIVIATTWNIEVANDLWKKISTFDPEFQKLFVRVPTIINSKMTIIMAPDGSKKGWDTAERGNQIRNQFIQEIKKFDYDDGSSPFDWIEVGYGEFGQKVLRGNCKNCYNDKDYAE